MPAHSICAVKIYGRKAGGSKRRQQKQIEAVTAGWQKVSALVETSRTAPQVVNNP